MSDNFEEELVVLTVYSELTTLIGSYHTSLHLSNAEKASEILNQILGLINQKLMPLRAQMPSHM